MVIYRDTLSDLQSLFTVYSKLGDVILDGDYNGQILNVGDLRLGNAKTALLSRFVRDNGLNSITKFPFATGPVYTYMPSKQAIDHN